MAILGVGGGSKRSFCMPALPSLAAGDGRGTPRDASCEGLAPCPGMQRPAGGAACSVAVPERRSAGGVQADARQLLVPTNFAFTLALPEHQSIQCPLCDRPYMLRNGCPCIQGAIRDPGDPPPVPV